MEEFRAIGWKNSTLSLPAFQVEEEGHKPRKPGSFWKLGEKKEKGNAAYQELRERNALEQGSANGGS